MRGENTRALWRVRPYLRPYVPQLATMVVLSLTGIGAGLVVPLVMRRIVDGPIARGDRGAVLPLAVLVLVLGLVERSEHYRAPRPPECAGSRAAPRDRRDRAVDGSDSVMNARYRAVRPLPPPLHPAFAGGHGWFDP